MFNYKKIYVDNLDKIKIAEIPELQVKIKQQEMVSISLEEYENLKKENEYLRKCNVKLTEFRDKVIKPLAKLDIPRETLDKILEGEFETKVFVDNLGMKDPFVSRLGYVVELNDWDLGIR